MGQEFGQLREWSEARSLDWELTENPLHKGIQEYVKDLNHMYQEYSAFYFNDNDTMGFEWTKVDDADSGIVAFVRRGKTAKDQLLFVCNFVPVERVDYKIGVPCLTKYTEILSSDDEKYGGLGRNNKKPIEAVEEKTDRFDFGLPIHVPPLSVSIFKYDYIDDETARAERKKAEEKKTAVKKAPAKKATAKSTATKTAVKKTPAKKAATKTTAKKTATKAPAKKTSAK